MEVLNDKELQQIAERLYRFMNPEGTMDTPNSAYISTDKWYRQYRTVDTRLGFLEWCIKEKGTQYQPVSVVSDGDGHWYVIPSKDAGLFVSMLERGEADEYTEFNDRFGRYMTGGDINNKQLYAAVDVL